VISRFILIPALIALVFALGLALHWRSERDDWRAEAERQAANVEVLEESRDQAALAYLELEANLTTARARAAEYDALRRAILEGDNDVELPDWFSDYVGALVDRLRRAGAVATGGADGSE
jgi:hypothetical protein